jgi:hypothetical protein
LTWSPTCTFTLATTLLVEKLKSVSLLAISVPVPVADRVIEPLCTVVVFGAVSVTVAAEALLAWLK